LREFIELEKKFLRGLLSGMPSQIPRSVVPGSSFFSRPEDGRALVRFAFCKREETLDEAARRLERWRKAR